MPGTSRVLWTAAMGLLFASGASRAAPVAGAQVDSPARARIAALAQLAIRSKSAEGLDLIRAGLLDRDPAVRSASARVAHVMALQELLPELRKSLAGERDPEAAREAAWVLSSLDDTSDSDALLFDLASRPPVSAGVIQSLVAGRGSRLTSSWAALKGEFEAHPTSVTAGLRDGLHASAGAVFTRYAIRDGLESLGATLLSERSIRLEDGVAIAGLTAASAMIRTSAYFRLAEEGQPVGQGSLPQRPTPESLDERIGRHLFEAAAGVELSEGLDGLAAAVRSDDEAAKRLRSRFFRASAILRGLKPPERRSLLTAAKVEEVRIEALVVAKFEGRSSPAPDPPTAQAAVVKTPSGHPLEFARSVIEASGCRGRERLFGGVEAHYRPGGRPVRVVRLQADDLTPSCADLGHILGATALVTDGHANVVGVVPQRPEFLGCLVESRRRPASPSDAGGTEAADTPQPVRITGGLKEPTKIRNIVPGYPGAARENRVQGIVIIEATISPSGCVSSLRVLRGVDPLLDFSALDAVSGWQYTPTLVNGAPVPVIMTVTVSFRLK